MLNLIGAYGRTYTTADEARRDWDANRDFKIINGPYINRTDAVKYKDTLKHTVFTIWYNDNNNRIKVTI